MSSVDVSCFRPRENELGTNVMRQTVSLTQGCCYRP